MSSYPLTAGVTLLIALLLFYTAFVVGGARKRYGIRAPATTGHEIFERALRVQANSNEWALMFLPVLWVLAVFVSDRVALCVGLAGLGGRVWYALAYQRDPASRGKGYLIGMLAFGLAGLWSGLAVARKVFGF